MGEPRVVQTLSRRRVVEEGHSRAAGHQQQDRHPLDPERRSGPGLGGAAALRAEAGGADEAGPVQGDDPDPT